MRQAELLKRIKKIARDAGMELEFVRHGANHDQYRINGQLIPIPRHREIKERTAQHIIDDATEATKGPRS